MPPRRRWRGPISRTRRPRPPPWWNPGFAHEEDIAFKKLIENYQKASGNKIDDSIIPYAPMRQKIVSAITSGSVPDLFQNSPTEVNALYAWDDKLVDVSDVIETRKNEFTEAALASAYSYNNEKKTRGYYRVPYQTSSLPNHVWKSLVEKAGYNMEDLPKTWDAYYNFFKDVQKKLRDQGNRRVYGLGFQVTTNGNDPNNVFNYFLIRLWRQQHRRQERKTECRRSAGQGSDHQGHRVPGACLQGRLRAAERDQLE